MKQEEEQKTIHVNHTNKENYNKPFSKEQLTRAIQATKKSAPGPDKIHDNMMKHLPPERLDSLLALCKKKAARILPRNMFSDHYNTNIKTWKRPYEPFKLSSNCPNKYAK